MKPLVSIILPTKNSSFFLENCLRSIKKQTYKHIEVIVVDGYSTDQTIRIATKYHCKIYTFAPKVKKYAFDASIKRNYGAKKAKGDYIYWVDADMELPRTLIEEAVNLCIRGAHAVILPEDSYGEGLWAGAKNLERRCYWNDNTVECPRFLKKAVWKEIGGFDETLGAGGDDLDIHQKVLAKGYRVARAKNTVLHNEGHLTLTKMFKKHFMYGLDTIKYFRKRPISSIISYFPIRMAYLKNIQLFINRPRDACLFIIMRSTEYLGSFLGLFYSLLELFTIPKKRTSITIDEYAKQLPQYYDDTIPHLLEKYLKIKKYTSILDAGCGDGSLLYALNKKNYLINKTVTALDLSRARINLIKYINPSIQGIIDSAENMKKIPPNSIDILTSTYVIEHVDDQKMIRSIHKILKKNGIAYISTIYKKWYAWYYKRKNGQWLMDLTHLREYTNDTQLLSLIDQKKFIILENKKSQLFFPILDFIFRRLPMINRNIFIKHKILRFFRNIKLPIPGYYEWEIVIKKIYDNP